MLEGDYATGWVVSYVDGARTSAHDESAGTFFATVAIQPDRDLGVVVMTNAGGEKAGEACQEAVLLLLAQNWAIGI